VLPERYRQRLRTTNAQERLNEVIRRRERVIRSFPNRDFVMRLLGDAVARDPREVDDGDPVSRQGGV